VLHFHFLVRFTAGFECAAQVVLYATQTKNIGKRKKNQVSTFFLSSWLKFKILLKVSSI
jgi:hypothetical protein